MFLCNVHKLFLTYFNRLVYRSYEAGDNSFDALKCFTSLPVTLINNVVITKLTKIFSSRKLQLSYNSINHVLSYIISPLNH